MGLPGKFYGIGVGPGDPDLLTLKAYRALQGVDVICVPKSAADKDSLALNVVNKALAKEFNYLELSFPMSRDREVLERCWAEAGEAVAARVKEGQHVAFVSIGDPMFYSTYGYVLAHLKKYHPGLETETIPGITSIAASSAFVNTPLTEGEENLVVLPAAYGIEGLREILSKFDNVVLMKVNRRFEEVLELLKEMGLSDKAAYVSRCGHADQYFTLDLEDLRGQKLDYMSLLIIKKKGFVKGMEG